MIKQLRVWLGEDDAGLSIDTEVWTRSNSFILSEALHLGATCFNMF